MTTQENLTFYPFSLRGVMAYNYTLPQMPASDTYMNPLPLKNWDLTWTALQSVADGRPEAEVRYATKWFNGSSTDDKGPFDRPCQHSAFYRTSLLHKLHNERGWWWGRSTTRSKHESPFSWLWKYHKQALYLCNDGKTTFWTLELAFHFSFFLLFFLCSAYVHCQIPSFEPIGTLKPLNLYDDPSLASH